ncbi:hypothetical protein B0H63DRAFT_155218 [Podospora didyma]|uniref:Uncharacterized protein n=1 Tax=Podospora didyma TaxID=330526 RepID=A0AAE0U1D4_9PEZI|nr:hypothetical protein B0H63DRAFT_155218 [Podospora didyma]
MGLPVLTRLLFFTMSTAPLGIFLPLILRRSYESELRVSFPLARLIHHLGVLLLLSMKSRPFSFLASKSKSNQQSERMSSSSAVTFCS